MSYNLLAEGHLDLFELSQCASHYEPLELFPVPASAAITTEASEPARMTLDALGIAIPLSRAGAEAGAALRALVEFMWTQDANVFDLYTGEQISTPSELAGVLERISG